MACKALSPARKQIFNFIVKFKRAHDGNSPSLRQIADTFGHSTSTVNYHLRLLETFGLLQLGGDGQSRMISVVGGTWVAPILPKLMEADAGKLLNAVVSR